MVFDAVTGNAISLVNLSSSLIIPSEIGSKFSNLIILFQAIGGLIIAYIVFNIISLWQNRKKRKDTERMRDALERIDKRLERLEKKKR
jgi:predicted permease